MAGLATSPSILDRLDRPLRKLRVSVTDRCNLRCRYCMPDDSYRWLPRKEILSFEEVESLVSVFGDLGVSSVRLTGGEPLLRRRLFELVARIARDGRLRDIAMTTNGVFLEKRALELKEAGLCRVTVSLDTVRPDRFLSLTRRDRFEAVVRGIEEAARVGLSPVKVNSVIVRGVNDDEICELLRFCRERGVELRYIEYMDVSGAIDWSANQVVSSRELLERIAEEFGEVEPLPERDGAPARRYRLGDGTVFGIVASVTEPFCGSCDRSRLTATGRFIRCLFQSAGIDLRAPLREGAAKAEIAGIIRESWLLRDHQGALERLGLPVRSVRAGAPEPEMHVLGG